MSPREKWFAFLRGENVGPMVAPLVDDWSLDIEYYWPYDEADPYPPGQLYHTFSQQMAMAKLCGYDPLYYVSPPFVLREPLQTTVTSHQEGERTITESRTETPYGPLVGITEMLQSTRTLQPEVQSADDFRKVMWINEQEMQLDIDQSIFQGHKLLEPMREKGVVGTWWGAPGVRGIDRDEQYYYMEDYPELYRQALEGHFQLQMRQLDVLRAMGFDFLFYCVDGTDWISPRYFEEFVAPYATKVLAHWRELGGFVVWHSCGHIAEFIRRGYYNQFLPEIFETLSEPPFGNLPSLRWAREQLDPRIATKGNIDLQLIKDGPTDAIRAAVQRVKKETAGFRHIIGASDDILHGTPLKHMQALVDEARQH